MAYVKKLDGNWQLRQVGSEESFTAKVPGCVHLDLVHAKRIEDPFYADNEFRVSWVHECDWEFSRVFTADKQLLGCDRVFLECDGLDTVAQVTLNGRVVGETENMYVQHRFEVTGLLEAGENTVTICFTSPVNHVKSMMEHDALMSPGESLPGAPYTRKSPSQWGWDWGPKLPSSGIWRSIRLAGYETVRLEDVRVRQKHNRNGSVSLDVRVSIEHFAKGPCTVEVTLTHPGGKMEHQQVRVIGSGARCVFQISEPELWWPNGYGRQPLYTVEAVVFGRDGELGRMSRRTGLRTVRLEQKKDQYGRSFEFVVNGVKLFCKGANWIPADQFPARMTPERYRHLITSAAGANMNMLRIWGGGIYESDAFYDLCDEHGILIWHDFMFACSLYPVTREYLANVRHEVEFNVARLRNHPCIALWCGNNEIEWALAAGWYGEKDKNSIRRQQYSKIFYDLIPSLIGKLDPDTSYWPSSPASDQPFDDPNGETSGDGHYWDVWHGRQPFTAYRTQFHRFMSEFGFESFPAFETCKSFARDEDLNAFSHVMECHQKNSAGNGLILHYLAQTFRMPRNFEMMCYVSQVLQAEAMRFGVEHWRRNRDRCSGTLYWQFNDCWPVCSWSSVDYYGRWKVLNYAARRFYSPILLSICEDGTRAEVHITNDTAKPAKIEVRWSLERLDGTVLRKSKVKTRIEAGSSKMLGNLDFTEELQGDNKRNCVLVHELLVGGKRVSLGMTPFVPSKHLDLPQPRIVLETRVDETGTYVDVRSEAAARFVWLSIPRQDVVFSDNGFDIPAGRKVTVKLETAVSEAALGRIRAHSLRDSY